MNFCYTENGRISRSTLSIADHIVFSAFSIFVVNMITFSFLFSATRERKKMCIVLYYFMYYMWDKEAAAYPTQHFISQVLFGSKTTILLSSFIYMCPRIACPWMSGVLKSIFLFFFSITNRNIVMIII